MDLTAREVARILSLSEREVRERARGGKLPYIDANERMLFNRQAILEWALARGHPLNLGAEEVEAGRMPPLVELFSPSRFHYDLQGRDFAEVLRSALDVFELPPGTDKELIYDLLVSREKLMTTALGDGLAIPHLRVPVIVDASTPTLGVFFTKVPIDMGAIDGVPVHTLFLLLSLTPKQHLELLARLSFLFRKPEFVSLLRSRAKPDEIIGWIRGVTPAGNHAT